MIHYDATVGQVRFIATMNGETEEGDVVFNTSTVCNECGAAFHIEMYEHEVIALIYVISVKPNPSCTFWQGLYGTAERGVAHHPESLNPLSDIDYPKPTKVN